MNEIIEKYNLKLETIKEVINTSNDESTVLTAQAVERFIKQFINDLKSLQIK